MREGWEYKKLGEVAAFYRGLTYTGKDEVDFSNNVVLRSNNVDLVRNTLNLNELKYISDEITIPKDKMVKKGSILMCMSNGSKQHIGKVAYINKDYNCAFGGFMGLIIPNENYIIPKLLYYYCCSCTFKQFVLSIVNGANINNLRFSDLSNKTVPIPFFSIQSVILSELDMITEMISKYDEQLKELYKLSQSIFYEMFGDPMENEKGWEMSTIEMTCIIKSGNSEANYSKVGTLPYIKVSDMNLPLNSKYINTYSLSVDFEQNKKNIIPIGATIFPKRGGAIFTNKKRITNKEICCDLNIMAVIPGIRIQQEYLYMYFMFIDFSKLPNGSSVPQINNKDIGPLKIAVPPLPLQQSFARKIEAIEAMKSKVREAKKEAETLLAARMQYWFE